MQKLTNSAFRRTALMVSTIIFLAAANVSNAATHIIMFGGTVGNTYSPNTLNVFVGDTIQWQGSFGFHPLSSKSIPTGAQSFHNASGTVFSYLVTASGTYNYQCDDHVNLGMTGSFNALSTAGVENSLQPGAFRLEQNFPNPFNPATNIIFQLPGTSNVTLKIFNAIGQEVATLANEPMAAGSYSRTWNAASMPSGVYFYRLQTGSFSETKKLILTK